MRILQRRNNSRTKNSPAASHASARMIRTSGYQDLLWSRWQALSSRDQLALSILTIFLVLLIGGFGGYTLNQSAKNSKAEYQQQVTDYFWLRSQAGNIDTSTVTKGDNNSPTQPAASRVSALLNAAGINDAQVVAAGESVQLSFANSSQGVVSGALGQLEQQGWQFNQLTMQQDISTKQIQVQATVAF